jgi:hypothetical protein
MNFDKLHLQKSHEFLSFNPLYTKFCLKMMSLLIFENFELCNSLLVSSARSTRIHYFFIFFQPLGWTKLISHFSIVVESLKCLCPSPSHGNYHVVKSTTTYHNIRQKQCMSKLVLSIIITLQIWQSITKYLISFS